MLNRETGEPIWPIEERPVPQSNVPGEKTSPTQPFPTKPKPFDRQGFSLDDLIDFTPALQRRGARGRQALPASGRSSRRPSLATPGRPAGDVDASGRRRRRELARRLVRPGDESAVHPLAHGCVPLPNIAADLASIAPGDADAWRGRSWCGGPRRGAWRRAAPWSRRGPPAAVGRLAAAARRRRSWWPRGGPGPERPRRHDGPGPAAGQAALRPHHRVRHEQRRHALAEGAQLDARRHQEPSRRSRAWTCRGSVSLGRIFIGVLVTKTLVIAGDGGVHTNARGETVALLRAYDKATGADIWRGRSCRPNRPARR